MSTYNPGQLRTAARFVDQYCKPKWLVLGGPANSDEAQTAVEVWPGIEVIACEPVARHREWQFANGFPRPDRLLPFALAENTGPLSMCMVDGTSGSTIYGADFGGVVVEAVTLDWLDEKYGPFEDAFLWLDIEGSELATLRGASNLLGAKRVRAVNVEVCLREPETNKAIRDLMTSYGFKLVDTWNRYSGAHQDELWVG